MKDNISTQTTNASNPIADDETRFRAFVVESSDVLYRMSPDWTEMRELAGQGLLADTARPSEDWRNAYLPPEDRAMVDSAIASAIEGKRMFELEHPVRRADGTIGWVYSRAVPMFDDDGEITEWLGAAKDVTERKNYEEALRHSEERFRLVADNISQLAWTCDALGNVNWYNQRWLDFTGLSFHEMKSWGWEKVQHPDHVERVVAGVRDAASRGEPWEDTFPLRRSDGEYRWFYSRARPIHDADGEIVQWFGTNTDVTDRLRTEEALRESEKKYRTLFDTMDEGYCVMETRLDERGDVVDLIVREVNRSWEEKTGLADPLGRSMSEILPNLEGHWLRNYTGVIRTGVPIRAENYMQDLDRWFSAHYSLVGELGSRLVAVVFDDITERKRAELTLTQSKDRQAFLLRLSDALRAETSVDGVANLAVSELAKHLHLDRCYLVSVDQENNCAEVTHQFGRRAIQPLPQKLSLSNFPAVFQKALMQTVVCDDIAVDTSLNEIDKRSLETLGYGAFVGTVVRRGQGKPIWAIGAATNAPRAWNENEVALLEDATERVWSAIEHARANHALRESEERFREFGENSSDVLWVADLEKNRLEYLSPAYERIWGRPRDAVMADYGHWADTLHPDDREEALQAMPRLMGGEAYVADYRIVRPDGEVRAIRDTGFPMRNAHGKVVRAGGISQEVTHIRAAEERQDLLLAELQHRVRNILGMVRSMARQSIKHDESADEYLGHLLGRVDAIARTQVLLTRAPDAGVDLEGLVREELLAHGGDRDFATVEGPRILLSPKAAEILTLTIHELTTNSVKYGVLGDGRGTLAIRWERSVRDREDWLTLGWHERGDIPPPAEVQSGFGTELIERRVAYELRGEGSLHIGTEDVRAEIAFPLRHAASLFETAPAPAMLS